MYSHVFFECYNNPAYNKRRTSVFLYCLFHFKKTVDFIILLKSALGIKIETVIVVEWLWKRKRKQWIC